jgi:hypothetical protein
LKRSNLTYITDDGAAVLNLREEQMLNISWKGLEYTVKYSRQYNVRLKYLVLSYGFVMNLYCVGHICLCMYMNYSDIVMSMRLHRPEVVRLTCRDDLSKITKIVTGKLFFFLWLISQSADNNTHYYNCLRDGILFALVCSMLETLSLIRTCIICVHTEHVVHTCEYGARVTSIGCHLLSIHRHTEFC